MPGTGPLRRPTAAFATNASGRFQSVHVHVKLAVAARAGADPGRDRARRADPGLGRARRRPAGRPAPTSWSGCEAGGHLAFVYADRDGNAVPAPNGSALDAAALVNRAGNVLARHAAPRARRLDLPAPRRLARRETACWRPRAASASSSTSRAPCAAGGGGVSTRSYAVSLTIPDNEAFTALATLERLGLPVARVAPLRRLAVRGRRRRRGRSDRGRRGGRDDPQPQQAPPGRARRDRARAGRSLDRRARRDADDPGGRPLDPRRARDPPPHRVAAARRVRPRRPPGRPRPRGRHCSSATPHSRWR